MNKITHGIIHLSVVPGRAEPSHRSEQVTQLLFGECFKVLRSENEWHWIKNQYDAYECWIDAVQFKSITEDQYEEILRKPAYVVSEPIVKIKCEDASHEQLISIGAQLPLFNKGQFRLLESSFTLHGTAVDVSHQQISSELIISTAESLLHTSYQWGGRSPLGIDCSGFTQLVFKCLGIKLPRDAYQQADAGYSISFMAEARTGDLVFFDNEEGRITHVGIVHQTGYIIHASGKVRIDKLDHQGIFNEETGRYTHKLRLIKRLV
jgi:cell wall-associated NlpC family hydrolase